MFRAEKERLSFVDLLDWKNEELSLSSRDLPRPSELPSAGLFSSFEVFALRMTYYLEYWFDN